MPNRPLEQMLSPMIKNRTSVSQTPEQQDLLLMDKIRQQKIDVVNQRISPADVELVAPEVVASWIRSYNYGLDMFNYNYGPIMDKYDFGNLMIEKNLLLKSADPYINRIKGMSADSDYIILLTDEKGVMLRVVEGNERLSKQNARFNLVPGSIWNEETVGTCAHCITLINGEPIQICGPEHYCETYETISCSAAPIYDGNNNLAATLNIVTPSFYHQSSLSLGFVASMSWAMENEFRLELKNRLLSVTMDAADEAVFTVNKNGIITNANVTARKIFNLFGTEVAGRPVEEVLGHQPLVTSVLETGKPVFDAEIELLESGQRLHLRSVQPVRDSFGKNLGCVITLRKLARDKKSGGAINDFRAGFTFERLIGSSPQIVNAINLTQKFASLDANIILNGESGTGKEAFAQAIHNECHTNGPFIAINCAAIPKTLVETELFGYEGGSFTGAERQGRPGKIELAHGGTLFLDEIGDMPLELQPVLLRVLEEKKLMRVGGSRYIPVDFKLVTATNKNLMDMINNKQFREDLYYRLKGLEINIPPLRERGSDIILLAKHFINGTAEKQGITAPVLSDAAVYLLMDYSWPGNIRQLENAMRYAVNVCSNGIIEPGDFPGEISSSSLATDRSYRSIPSVPITGDKTEDNSLTIKEMERISIAQALIKTGNNLSETAKLLGVSRSTLYRKTKEHGLLEQIRSKS